MSYQGVKTDDSYNCINNIAAKNGIEQMLSYLKQEVVDYLSVFLLKVLPEVSILPSLVAINIMKVEIKMPCDLALVT